MLAGGFPLVRKPFLAQDLNEQWFGTRAFAEGRHFRLFSNFVGLFGASQICDAIRDGEAFWRPISRRSSPRTEKARFGK
jgi:hypothetical protein